MFDGTDDRRDRDRDRGQVGIGTLIVFIAMVLVAAIAAGVLINTAGFLQSSAEQSGEQAAEQTTNRLVETNTIGTASGGQITNVEMTVRLSAGSDNVDLEDTTIQWVTSGSSASLVADTLESQEEGADGTFSWEALRDDDGSITDDNTLNDQADRSTLLFNLGEGSLSNLSPGDTVDVSISTRAGGETTVTLVVPDSLSGKTSVTL
ncbi:archaellin/type IV pilin N-terminal domain-containing protein [Halapricum desulfuricans]|uniref:Flagellin n=1 Tax=Halapricum desulfuricans TaxID=2841257 RepID=A0A897MY72_9EURY|nr:archaellin/type IV pilin N-terminal domain-containing protein [Halapricum desulfuricans]QSG07050.1 Archaeal flagellin [Halapricum desulfuricans]